MITFHPDGKTITWERESLLAGEPDMEENKVATDSSAPNSPELTRLSGEQAEERTAREIRANEFCDKYRRKQKMVGNNGGFYPQQTVELLAAYAESECSRLASRVEELEAVVNYLVPRLDQHEELPDWAQEIANGISQSKR